MKDKKWLYGIIIFVIVALLVFFILGFLRKGPPPMEEKENVSYIYFDMK